MIGWIPFYNPISLAADAWTLWLVVPLCASVAIIYKTLRTYNLSRLPLEILGLMGYMIGGLIAMGFVLWIIQVMFV